MSDSPNVGVVGVVLPTLLTLWNLAGPLVGVAAGDVLWGTWSQHALDGPRRTYVPDREQ